MDKEAILEAIKANEEAGLSRDEAIKKAIDDVATNLGLTKAELLDALNTTEEALAEDIADVAEDVADVAEDVADLGDRVGTPATESEPATGIYKEIQDLVDQGSTLEDAIAAVAGSLDTTKEELLDALNTTEETLAEDIAGVAEDVAGVAEDVAGVAEDVADLENSILDKMKENEDAGIERDEALSKAIEDVSAELGTTKDDLLTAIGKTEESILTRFDEDMADLGLDIETVANFVGKPAQDVTQADIDTVVDLIEQQEALTDPTSFVPTDQQLQYDVNNDGVVDINDQNMLEQAFGGQDVSLGGQFAATGLYAYNDAIAAQQKLEAEQQFKEEQELEQKRQQEIQTNIQTTALKGKFDDLAREQFAIQAAQPTVATTKKMGLAEIGPQYKFDTIFRDQQQEQFYSTPFGGYGPSPFGVGKAAGGKVENSTDRLLKIIGEK